MRIANMYLNSKGTDRNIPEAVRWLDKAAEQGNPDAAYQLGYIYSSEEFNIYDAQKSNEYYKNALHGYELAEIGNNSSTAEYRIGLLYLNGKGVDKNVDMAIRWLYQSAQNNNSSAWYKLAALYDEGTEIPEDKEKALLCYECSAVLDNPYAHYSLGNIYIDKGDIKQAAEHFEKSAAQDVPHACYKLGQIYSNEEYGLTDYNRSYECYKKALELYIADYEGTPNDFTAYRIGQMYLNSLGTEYNLLETVNWFKKSSELGNPDAAYQLGYIYKSEKYGIRNDELSNKYFSFALSEYRNQMYKNPYDSNIALQIGTFYHYGLGVEQDINKAIAWYIRAVELGNQKAQQKIDEANQRSQMALMTIAATACHFGQILNTETIAAAKNRYVSDTKLLKNEKMQKIYAGQAVDDSAQSYDY